MDDKLKELLTALDAIDRAIVQFDPAYRPQKVKVSRTKRVELMRSAFDVLRAASAPMSLREIAVAIMERAGEAPSDSKAVVNRMNKLRTSLRRQADNGALRQTQGPGQFMLWEVIR